MYEIPVFPHLWKGVNCFSLSRGVDKHNPHIFSDTRPGCGGGGVIIRRYFFFFYQKLFHLFWSTPHLTFFHQQFRSFVWYWWEPSSSRDAFWLNSRPSASGWRLHKNSSPSKTFRVKNIRVNSGRESLSKPLSTASKGISAYCLLQAPTPD